ncbi:MAG: PD40 domain-containing protein [Candidatus Aminicenantes bacterium]|nr:PD40 domain-containing protein [Candidatus Aminicenantes bacterium]
MKKQTSLFIILFLTLIWVPFGAAQSIYFPYYMKNKVNYENFQWKHYETDHFDIHYYTENRNLLKMVAEMSESAYQLVSNELKHHLSEKVPLIFYNSSTDLVQTNITSLTEDVLGVSEPVLHRVIVRADMAPDELQDLIEHELTHIFEFDLLWGSPTGSIYSLSGPPLWVFEGFSEYTSKTWSIVDELTIRDAVLNDRFPFFTESGNLISQYAMLRMDYIFGHAIYEFMEDKFGKSSIREFWRSLKSFPRYQVIQSRGKFQIFNNPPQEFYHEFKKYMRDKYKDFLLKENPENYSLPIGPKFPMNPYFFSFSHSLSPSGEIAAVLTINIKDQDYDILLFSVKDGSKIKNITGGYTIKYEYIKGEIDPSYGRDLAWSDDGNRLAFFARAGHKHSLFIVDIITGDIIDKINIPVDHPSAPAFIPGKNEIVFTAFVDSQHDIYSLNLSTEKITNLTEDDLFEKAPVISPDGKHIAYTLRLDAFDKLFISPLDNLKQKKQLTFGRENTIAPSFSPDAKKMYFSSDRNGAFNIYSLDLDSGTMIQYTDVRTGNFFPNPIPGEPEKIVFASFNKGAFQIFSSKLEGKEIKTVEFKDRTEDEKYERFEPIITLDINEKKIKKYKGLGNLFLMGRPPINAIVSTDGSILGGSAITFTDLLGDHAFNLVAYQVRTYRSYSFSYLNMKRRLQFMANAFQYTIYYYPYEYYYDPIYSAYPITYEDAIATRTISGATVAALYPFNRYYRMEAGLGYYNYEEDYQYGSPYGGYGGYSYFLNGNIIQASVSLIGETTLFNYYGPKNGHTFALSLSQAIPVSDNFLCNTTLEADLRKYFYIGGESLFAVRFKAFASRGDNPFIFYYGGNNQVRSVYFFSIVANEGWYTNIEFRFPLINAASTLIGQIGPVRGAFFFDLTRSKIGDNPARYYDSTGSSIIDALGSYGFGFQFFFLGLPIHIEFVKRLEIPSFSDPLNMNSAGDLMTKFWIGYDF